MNDLIEAARVVRGRAYAPYSKFLVGCAVRGVDGQIYSGVNIENASYPQGICAERSAVAAMVSGGCREIREVAVVGSHEAPCTPCGGCRQWLNEFARPQTPVHCCGAAGAVRTVAMHDLLPHAFGPKDLGVMADCQQSAADAIRAATALEPKLGIVLGSGLGALSDRIDVDAAFEFSELPGFPTAGVKGHAGRLLIGHLNGEPVACLAGRVHTYEGDVRAPLKVMIRTLAAIGCKGLLLTNAAGSLRAENGPGSLVRVIDHINLQGTSPLVGPNDDAIGPRFFDMSKAYDEDLGGVLDAQAGSLNLMLPHGVYAAWLGPAFETPAEIRALAVLGADLVGMSTVPEVLVARHAGIRCAAISMVTNLAAGMAEQTLSHEQTLEQAGQAAPRLVALIEASVPGLCEVLDAV